MESDLLELDFDCERICRVCLLHDNNLSTIFSKCIVEGSIMSFPKVFEYAVDLKVSPEDGYPQNICPECKSKIILSYIIKRKCSNSFKLLFRLCEKESKKCVEKCSEPTSQIDENIHEEFECADEIIITASEESGHIAQTIKFENVEENQVDCKAEENYADFTNTKEVSSTTDSNLGIDFVSETNEQIIEIVEHDEHEEIALTKITESQSQEESLFCVFCKIHLKNSEAFKNHCESHNAIDSMVLSSLDFYRCGRCRTVFSDRIPWQNHLITEDECRKNLAFLDENCTDYQILDSHKGFEVPLNVSPRIISSHFSNSVYICDYCNNFQTTSLDDLFVHFEIEHFENNSANTMSTSTSNEPHQCNVCNLIFAHVHHSLKHMYYKHSNEFTCLAARCNIKYTTLFKLIIHMEEFHLSLANNWVSDRSPAKKQKRREKLKNFFCQVCDKSFKQVGDLKVHLRLHTGERPYKCDVCNKTFRTIGNKSDHMSTHAVQNNFQCEICKEKFKSLRILKSHAILHNGIKNHICPECGKKFSRKQHVTMHMKVHKKKLPNLKTDVSL